MAIFQFYFIFTPWHWNTQFDSVLDKNNYWLMVWTEHILFCSPYWSACQTLLSFSNSVSLPLPLFLLLLNLQGETMYVCVCVCMNSLCSQECLRLFGLWLMKAAWECNFILLWKCWLLCLGEENTLDIQYHTSWNIHSKC